MIISHSKKFIFIHIYKVAGTSISNMMDKYSSKNQFFGLKHIFLGHPKIFSNDFEAHIMAPDLKSLIPSDIYNEYFKFCFVRNPWDWQVSLYHFMLGKETHRQHDLVKSLGSYENYLDWRVNIDLVLQSDFIFENNTSCVDFIGKIENINSDITRIIDAIGIQNRQLPWLNKSDHKEYKKYYTPKTRKLIEYHFEKDIDTFKYSF